ASTRPSLPAGVSSGWSTFRAIWLAYPCETPCSAFRNFTISPCRVRPDARISACHSARLFPVFWSSPAIMSFRISSGDFAMTGSPSDFEAQALHLSAQGPVFRAALPGAQRLQQAEQPVQHPHAERRPAALDHRLEGVADQRPALVHLSGRLAAGR